jgi:chromosome segregation ATPase
VEEWKNQDQSSRAIISNFQEHTTQLEIEVEEWKAQDQSNREIISNFQEYVAELEDKLAQRTNSTEPTSTNATELEAENQFLKAENETLKEKIQNLNLLVLEQLRVIVEWINN